MSFCEQFSLNSNFKVYPEKEPGSVEELENISILSRLVLQKPGVSRSELY